MRRLIFAFILLLPLTAYATQITTKQIADSAVTNPKVNDVSVSKITSAASAYFTYKPNNVSCSNGQVLGWDNTNARWSCLTSSGSGTVTSVATNGGLTGGPITTSGTISIAALGVTDSKINDVSYSKLSNGSGVYLTYKPNDTACTDQQVLSWDNTNGLWSCASGGSGTVTSVATDSTLTGGPITTTGTLGVASGGITSTELAALAVTDAKVNDVQVNKITSASGAYFTYQPNNIRCTHGQTLVFDARSTVRRWHCQNLYNDNLLPDSGFENGVTWNYTSGTVGIATTGSNLLVGLVSATFDADSAGDNITSINFYWPIGYSGKQGMARCLVSVPSGTATHKWSLVSGVTTLFNKTITSSSTPTYITEFFTFNSADSPQTLRLAFTSVAANEPLIVIDDCYVGPASDFSRMGNNSGVYLTYKPNNVACTNAQGLTWDNTNARWSCSSVISSVATGTGLTGGPVTIAGTISVATGGISSTELAALAVTDAKVNDVSVGKVTSPASAYFTYKPNSVSCTDQQIMNWDNTNARWVCNNATGFTAKSITSTYAVSNADDTLVASGASFTITLPTAVGIAGKRFTINHGGTSLTQVYTLNTTSSQTIGGIASGSYALYTANESLTIASDGTNWQIVNHQANTDWTNTGAITITATTTNPTKPTAVGAIVTDKLWWKRSGANMDFRYEYRHTSATGAAAGSGNYKFSLPANITIDTNKIETNGASTTNGFGTVLGYGWTSNVANNLSNATNTLYAFAYDSTNLNFKYLSAASGNDGRFFTIIASGSQGKLTDTNVSYYLTGSLPVLGWQP